VITAIFEKNKHQRVPT